jgi:ribosomal protein S9
MEKHASPLDSIKNNWSINMYIDPSSGGLIFQILAVMFGVISGAVLLFAGRIRMGIAKLRRTIREKRGIEEPAEEAPEAEE